MRTRWLLAPLTAFLLVLGACSPDQDEADVSDLLERLEAAEQRIDEATSLDISVVASSVPSNVSGLKSAEGVANRTPAFRGDVEVVSGGSSIPAEVVAVNGEVWAKTGFSPVFIGLDPARLNAPDPADLVGTQGAGVASLLTQSEDLTWEGKTRDGTEVLSTISGTLDAPLIAALLPTAANRGTFTVTYRLTDGDELHDMTIHGPFYGDLEATYVMKVIASDESVVIEAP